MKRLFAYLLVFSTLFVSQAPPILAGSRTNSTTRPLIQDVRSAVRQAEARFDSGNVSGAADLARRILEKYPNNAEAQALLEKCIATENADYEAAVASLDATKLADFKQKYPASSYVEDVSRRIDDLPYWLAAKEANTVEGYQKYLAESTNLLYKQEADDAIKDISVKQAYDVAVEKNTIQAYKDYIEEFPDSKFEKDASNKIARLMADKFNARSSYADRAAALAYAQNEMTRDYVNNKYNKATATKGSTTSPSTSTSTSTRTQSTTTTPSGDYRASRNTSSGKKEKPEPSVAFGIEATGEYYQGTYLLGVGPVLRFGKSDGILFATAAVKYARGGFHAKYTDYASDYRSWNDVNIEAQGNYISVPVTANLSLLGFYFGGGIVYNHLLNANTDLANPNSMSFLVQMGIIKRHWDLKIGMNLYTSNKSISRDPYANGLTFLVGASVYF